MESQPKKLTTAHIAEALNSYFDYLFDNLSCEDGTAEDDQATQLHDTCLKLLQGHLPQGYAYVILEGYRTGMLTLAVLADADSMLLCNTSEHYHQLEEIAAKRAQKERLRFQTVMRIRPICGELANIEEFCKQEANAASADESLSYTVANRCYYRADGAEQLMMSL